MFAPRFRPMRTSGTQASAFCGIAGCRNVRPRAYMCKYLCMSIHTDICRHMINVFPFCHDLVNSDNVVAQASEKLGTKSRVMSSRRPASHSSAHGTSSCSRQVAASGAFAAFDKSCPFRILSRYNSEKRTSMRVGERITPQHLLQGDVGQSSEHLPMHAETGA